MQAMDPLQGRLRDERFGSRKEWGAYINLTTVLHRTTVAQTAEFIAEMRGRLEQAAGSGAGRGRAD